MKSKEQLFDSMLDPMEQLPRKFTVNFDSIKSQKVNKVRVSVNSIQIGDLIDDNSEENDGYRFHDVFHYTFAAMLGWSPCVRSMMRRKRKSNPKIDHFEDGARATITEEAILLMIFSKAKQRDFFSRETKVDRTVLSIIKEMTTPFEVSVRSKKEWENAILRGYSLFRKLVENNGGKVHFDMLTKSALFEE